MIMTWRSECDLSWTTGQGGAEGFATRTLRADVLSALSTQNGKTLTFGPATHHLSKTERPPTLWTDINHLG